MDALNKETVLEDASLRENLILIGDMISDTCVVDKRRHGEVLTIGLVNNPKQISEYIQAFDVLITNDGNLTAVNAILKHLLEG